MYNLYNNANSEACLHVLDCIIWLFRFWTTTFFYSLSNNWEFTGVPPWNVLRCSSARVTAVVTEKNKGISNACDMSSTCICTISRSYLFPHKWPIIPYWLELKCVLQSWCNGRILVDIIMEWMMVCHIMVLCKQ